MAPHAESVIHLSVTFDNSKVICSLIVLSSLKWCTNEALNVRIKACWHECKYELCSRLFLGHFTYFSHHVSSCQPRSRSWPSLFCLLPFVLLWSYPWLAMPLPMNSLYPDPILCETSLHLHITNMIAGYPPLFVYRLIPVQCRKRATLQFHSIYFLCSASLINSVHPHMGTGGSLPTCASISLIKEDSVTSGPVQMMTPKISLRSTGSVI